ncbi:nuclear transport factor 2 family protein [Saccharopolyspora shandongensis]|uniref:nuclear transport factor 2 family protein n=1 Tax=Saccharopolyspora shandongensis TaxID=418495 RepID=UPI00342429A1
MRAAARPGRAMTLAAADRVELADLVARYAAAVDDRAFAAAAVLFAEDAVLAMPSPPAELGPVDVHSGRSAIAGALRAVEAFELTQHAIVGQVFDGDGRSATGRIACIAHHLGRRSSGEPINLVWHLRYADGYRKQDGAWLFARRELSIDWIETRTPRRSRVPSWSEDD